MEGRTINKKVIRAEIGFPGSPNNIFLFACPTIIGFPGLIETFQKLIFPPICLNAALI